MFVRYKIEDCDCRLRALKKILNDVSYDTTSMIQLSVISIRFSDVDYYIKTLAYNIIKYINSFFLFL